MNIEEFVPKEVCKIDLKKNEVLVWSLDYEQFKFVKAETVSFIVQTITAELKRTFPDNKVLVTIGKVDIEIIKELDE